MQMDMRSGRLSIPGLYNARDLGAMTNADGKALACHRLIRSDALDHLNEESIRLLSEYPTDVIIDLNGPFLIVRQQPVFLCIVVKPDRQIAGR